MDRSYKELLKLRRFPHTWCPGCGIGAVLKNVAMGMKELGWDYQEYGCRLRNWLFRKNVWIYEPGCGPYSPWPSPDSG